MKSQLVDNAGSSIDRETLLTVGLWLKEARELKGESLENVSKITRIGKTYLEAIEEGAVVRLPSQAYTRGFIRLYASHLGLSPDEALRMLSGQGLEAVPNNLQESPSPRPLPAAQPATGTGRTRKLLFALIFAAALAVIVFTIVNRKNPTGASVTANQPKTVIVPPAETAPVIPAAVPPLPAAATQPAAETAPTGAEKILPREGIVLRLKAVSSGRLHITIDGSVSQEYDLVAGDLVEWKAEKMFLLDLENAGSVEGELDGKRLAPFGAAGQKAHLIIGQHGVQHN